MSAASASSCAVLYSMPVSILPTPIRYLTVLVFIAGCGGNSPTGPSPTPASPATFSGSVTDTITGAPVSGFTALVFGSRLTVSAPGYVTRETRAGASSVDLIPEAGFDLDFYRQLARGSLDGTMRGLRPIPMAPSIHMQTTGLTAANIAALEQAARAVVPAMTGGRFELQAWTLVDSGGTGSPSAIVVNIVNDSEACGRAAFGTVWLNIASRCGFGGFAAYPGVLAHELGHVLGFGHVDRPGHMMRSGYESAQPTEIERRHAAIAYKRPAGNRDVDVDP